MTARELAISLSECIEADRGNGPEWDILKAQAMIEAHDAEVRDHGLSASDLACSDGGLYASHSARAALGREVGE